MKIFFNYLGQLRLYSLADLVLMLVALGAPSLKLLGAVILHISFLAYLESRHSHSYRAQVPEVLPYILAVVGLILVWKIEGMLYLCASYLYTRKNKNMAMWSPLWRGLQTFFLCAGIIGYLNPLTYLATILMILRNLAGDFRDIEKDGREQMKTIPVLLGFQKNIKRIHLYATIATSVAWWSFSTISVWWLLLVVVIEVTTYNWTPR